MKSQRITVSGRNLQFLQELSEQMDETNLAVVMTYLLTDVRCLGYQIGNKPQSQPLQAPIGYSFDSSIFEKIAPIQECDSDDFTSNEMDLAIARMVNCGMLDMSFQ